MDRDEFESHVTWDRIQGRDMEEVVMDEIVEWYTAPEKIYKHFWSYNETKEVLRVIIYSQ